MGAEDAAPGVLTTAADMALLLRALVELRLHRGEWTLAQANDLEACGGARVRPSDVQLPCVGRQGAYADARASESAPRAFLILEGM